MRHSANWLKRTDGVCNCTGAEPPRSLRNVATNRHHTGLLYLLHIPEDPLTMVRWQCINDMTVRSTFDGPERNWEKEPVVYLNVSAETHTTWFSRHHLCFDRQSYWRQPDPFLLAPTRPEIIPPPPLTSCFFWGSAGMQKNAKWMSFLSSDGKWWKPTAEKLSKASPKWWAQAKLQHKVYISTVVP